MKRYSEDDVVLITFWILAICIMVFAMTSCVTAKRCNAKFPPTIETITNHTTEIIRRDSMIQGATVLNTIYRDSIVLMPVNKWHYVNDTNGIASLRWYKDAYGNIQMQCDANSRLVELVRKEMKVKDSTTSKKVVEVKSIPFWIWLIIGGLILVIAKKYLHL